MTTPKRMTKLSRVQEYEDRATKAEKELAEAIADNLALTEALTWLERKIAVEAPSLGPFEILTWPHPGAAMLAEMGKLREENSDLRSHPPLSLDTPKPMVEALAAKDAEIAALRASLVEMLIEYGQTPRGYHADNHTGIIDDCLRCKPEVEMVARAKALLEGE